MNQPTEDRFKRLEEEQRQLKEEVRQLREQRTEPMKVTRIELDPGGIQNRLDNHAEMMKEQDEMLSRIYTDVGKSNTDIAILKGNTEVIKADINALRSDMDTLKTDMKQVKTVQSGHSKFFEEHGKRLATMATKDDISRVETRFDQLEKLMMQMIDRLPQPEGE